MAKAPITKRTVDAAKAADVEYVIWDDGGHETVKGFGLKVTPAGGRVYIYQYRLARPGMADKTTPRKYTIGKHGNLTPDQARTRAKELAGMVAQGIDPRQAELDALKAKDRFGLVAKLEELGLRPLAAQNVLTPFGCPKKYSFWLPRRSSF